GPRPRRPGTPVDTDTHLRERSRSPRSAAERTRADTPGADPFTGTLPGRTGSGAGGEHLGDHRHEGAERASPVADRVLLLWGHLGGGAVVAVRHEDRVVAEAAGAPRLAADRAVHRALDHVLLAG